MAGLYVAAIDALTQAGFPVKAKMLGQNDNLLAGRNKNKDIKKAVRNSSAETGGWGDGTYCAYHNDRLDRD
jgi:hypothetical protein